MKNQSVSQLEIGTLIRCADIFERRIAFFHEIGLTAIQLGGLYEEHLAATAQAQKASDELFELLNRYHIRVPSLFLAFPNQDWQHPDDTVGFVPEKFRAERLVLACRQMLWASRRKIPLIVCHVGFVPLLQGGAYERFIAEMRELVKFAQSLGEEFLFETGTESVAELGKILDDIGSPAAGINFDPANLLYYNQNDPAELLDVLGERVKVMHCKDAVRPAPGETYGHETVLGEGGTGFPALLARLVKSGFSGPLIIERELQPGPEQERDIAGAVKLIQRVLAEAK